MKPTIENISDWFDKCWLDKHLKNFTFEALQELIPFRDLLFELQEKNSNNQQ